MSRKQSDKSVESSASNSSVAARTSLSLIDQVKRQDIQAWHRLVELYSPLIHYWCSSLDVPRQDMPDVFQEVFCAVAKSIDKYNPHQTGATFRGWLRVVTRNKVIDQFRKSSRSPKPFGGTEAKHRLEQVAESWPTESDSSLNSNERSAYRDLFRRALENIRPSFKPQTWQAFWRVAVEGMATDIVAQELDMKPGTVRVAKSRVLQRLRHELGDAMDHS